MKVVPYIVLVAAVGLGAILRRRRTVSRTSRSPKNTAVRPRLPTLRRFLETRFGDVSLVAGRELRERIRGRIYRLGTVVMLIVVAAAVVIPTIVAKKSTSPTIGIVGSLSASQRSVVDVIGRDFNLNLQLTMESNLASAERDLRDGTIDIALDSKHIVLKKELVASDSSILAEIARSISARFSTLATIDAAHLSQTQIATLSHPVAVPIVGLLPAKQPVSVRASSIIGLILLFALLSQYSAWILLGVAEEKSSRVVEVLLATIRPIHLLAGKVIGIGAAALLQASAIVVFALILAKAVGSDVLQGAAPLELASSLLWLILGYAFYCWVYAAAGSLAERQDQLQSLSFPLMVPMLIGYITALTAATSGSASLFFKLLAYLPPTAPFAMPVYVGFGQATWWEFLIAVALSIVSTVFVARFAAGIYRRAILQTGQRVKLREVLRPSR